MSGGGFDRVSLAAGLAIGGFGAVLLLDQADTIHLGWGWLGAVVAAVLGVVLLVTGLEEARQARLRASPEAPSEP
jgi:hypothetical protein